MGQPYIGEIRMFAGNFAPLGWALCQGQLMAISDYYVLFNLIGTTYGGDGQNTFALPDLQSRLPIHAGTGGGATYQLGQVAGVESVRLTVQQIPAHAHAVIASSGVGAQNSLINAVPARHRDHKAFVTAASGVGGTAMHASTVAAAGGSQPHDNMPPYLGVNFIISWFGIFPSQT